MVLSDNASEIILLNFSKRFKKSSSSPPPPPAAPPAPAAWAALLTLEVQDFNPSFAASLTASAVSFALSSTAMLVSELTLENASDTALVSLRRSSGDISSTSSGSYKRPLIGSNIDFFKRASASRRSDSISLSVSSAQS